MTKVDAAVVIGQIVGAMEDGDLVIDTPGGKQEFTTLMHTALGKCMKKFAPDDGALLLSHVVGKQVRVTVEVRDNE